MSFSDDIRSAQSRMRDGEALRVQGEKQAAADLDAAIAEFYGLAREAEAVLRQAGVRPLPIFEWTTDHGNNSHHIYTGQRALPAGPFALADGDKVYEVKGYLRYRDPLNYSGEPAKSSSARRAGLRGGDSYILVFSDPTFARHQFRIADNDSYQHSPGSHKKGDLTIQLSDSQEIWWTNARDSLAAGTAATLESFGHGAT
ncbi:MAG TPA: hypothetical protein VHZ98_09485 [Galbitalea sp.]|jgi:hypothetical protein|nr:hypothetical protein [Galbitalea sp.]